MILNDVAGKKGLVQDTLFLLGNGVDLNSYLIADIVRNINLRKDMVNAMIMESYSGWRQIGDDFYLSKDLQIGVPLITFIDYTDDGNPAITIRFVEILLAGGTWQRLLPMTEEEFKSRGGSGLTENAAGEITGIPTNYIPFGVKIKLIPTPNYTLSDAVRIWVDEMDSDLQVDDPNGTPSYAKAFHRMLSIGAALDYALSHGMRDKVSYLEALWADYEKRLRSFYSKRYVDREPKGISSGRDNVSDYS